MNWARYIIDGLSNPFRKSALSDVVIYTTTKGISYKILATPWADSGFQGLQQIGFDVVSLNRLHSAFTVVKDQLCFEIDIKIDDNEWTDFPIVDGETATDQWTDFPIVDDEIPTDQWTDFHDIKITEFKFHEPVVGDTITQEDGTVHTVSKHGVEPQWYYDSNNACKNTIIINTMRTGGRE